MVARSPKKGGLPSTFDDFLSELRCIYPRDVSLNQGLLFLIRLLDTSHNFSSSPTLLHKIFRERSCRGGNQIREGSAKGQAKGYEIARP